MKSKIVLTLLFFTFFIVRIVGVGTDISNSDAVRWHKRSINFLEGLKSSNLSETYQKYHPGVTLMWLDSLVIQGLREIQQYSDTKVKTLQEATWYPITHGVSKIVINIFLTILLILQFFFIKDIFSRKTGLMYILLISLEPYFIGINRWFHLSSIENFLVFTSLLSLLYWRKHRKIGFFIFSAVLFGLGVLTKMSAGVMLIPLIYVILLSDLSIKEKIKKIFIFGLFSLLIFFILFPALWVDPFRVIEKMYSSLFGSVTGDIRANTYPLYINLFYYILIFLFKTSPITVLLSLFLLIKKKFGNYSWSERVLLLVMFIYFIFFTLTSQKIDRYVISFYQPLFLLISIFVANLNTKLLKLIVVSNIMFFLLSTYIYYPVYSSFVSPAFRGSNLLLKLNLYDNSGEYFAQSAFYLNQKSRDTVVLVPNNIESFSYYYNGELFSPGINTPDYLVQSYDTDRNNKDSFEYLDICPTLEKSFGPKGFETVFIYKCNNIK